MFNRKLKQRVEDLSIRVHQLECPHKALKFSIMTPTGFDDGTVFEEVNGECVRTIGYRVSCRWCDKFIKHVGIREKARMEYEQAKEEYNRVCGGDHGE